MTDAVANANTFASLITEKPVERFLLRLMVATPVVEELYFVSPIIGSLERVVVRLDQVCRRIRSERIRTFVVTNEPDNKTIAGRRHQRALDILAECNTVEIRYNPNLHAKVYICVVRTGGFALFGSGNLTETSIMQRIEVGMLINERGHGIPLVHELRTWANMRLRSQIDSKLYKKIEMRGH